MQVRVGDASILGGWSSSANATDAAHVQHVTPGQLNAVIASVTTEGDEFTPTTVGARGARGATPAPAALMMDEREQSLVAQLSARLAGSDSLATDDRELLRFLRARAHDADAALEMIRRRDAWRRSATLFGGAPVPASAVQAEIDARKALLHRSDRDGPVTCAFFTCLTSG